MGTAKREKRVYDFRGFTGPDVSMEVSLHEYGIAWKQVYKRKKEFVFVVGIHRGTDPNWPGEYGYDRFTFFHMTEKDYLEMIKEDWFDYKRFCSDIGFDVEESKLSPFQEMVFHAVDYHGYENIFGSCYDEGFKILGKY